MSTSVVRSRHALGITVLSAVLALLLTSGPAVAQGSAGPAPAGPDTPVSGPPATLGPGMGDGSIAAVPEDGLVDIRVQGWDHLDVAADGRTVTVYYYSGVADCYGLAGVSVDVTGSVPVIQLQTGTRPGTGACIEIAVLYHTVVTLDAPLVGGGAA
jgi:hypothetical protein